MHVGDVVVFSKGERQFKIAKILRVDDLNEHGSTFHMLHYEPVSFRPTIGDLDGLTVKIQHVPIDGAHVERNATVIGNFPVTEQELGGYFEFLKRTNFAAYAQEVGLDLNATISEANRHYTEACALGDAGERQQAIASYTKAIELFPMLYEAIDNRAFTYMELGQWSSAIFDFQESLQVNPEGKAAFFSLGECMLRLGMLDKAEAVFAEGAQRWPDQPHFKQFLEQARAEMAAGAQRAAVSRAPSISQPPQKQEPVQSAKRPFWKFW
jgi:tetratricopeptide (TPR) repeat protein